MKKLILIVGAGALCVAACSAWLAQTFIVSPATVDWAELPSVQRGPFTIYEMAAGESGWRHLYAKGKNISRPKHLFAYHRAADLMLSNTQTCFLINNYLATKANKVVVVDVESGRQREIGRAAVEKYRKDVALDPRLWILPFGHAFSPDDQFALVEVDLIYIAVSTAQQASELKKPFAARWYAVRWPTGEIVAEHASDPTMTRWWERSLDAGT